MGPKLFENSCHGPETAGHGGKGFDVPAIENNRQDCQYQLFESGEHAGFLQYRMSGQEMWFLHSSVSRSFKSAALVATLLGHVLEDARHNRFSVLPFCPAMRSFMGLHPEYTNLVPGPWRPRFTTVGPVENRDSAKRPLDYMRLTGSPRARTRTPAVVVP